MIFSSGSKLVIVEGIVGIKSLKFKKIPCLFHDKHFITKQCALKKAYSDNNTWRSFQKHHKT